MYNCKFCAKECKNNNSLRNHERLCKNNPNRQLTPYERGLNPLSNVHKYGAVGSNEGNLTCTEVFTRQCKHCGKWFKPAQIGGHIHRCSKVHNEDRHVIVGGVALDITIPQLQEYMKTHDKCEICGKSVEESVKYTGKGSAKRLCVDHDHSTDKFRGMLCQACNRQLGWYEKYKNEIDNYLNSK